MITKRKVFLLGLMFLFAAFISITILPVFLTKHFSFHPSEDLFSEIEFFLLFWCGCCYAYSSKYYRYEVLSVIGAIALYIIFAKYMIL